MARPTLTFTTFRRISNQTINRVPRNSHESKTLVALSKQVLDNWRNFHARKEAFAVWRDYALEVTGVDPLPQLPGKRKHRIQAWAEHVQDAFPHISWTKAKQVAALMKGDLDPQKFLPWTGRGRRSVQILEAIDVLLDGFGVESIPDPFQPRFTDTWVADYVNTGDVYNATVIYFNDEFYISTVGDFIEWYERENISEAVDADDIEQLQGEAMQHGDRDTVDLCEAALEGNEDAWLECARIIVDARRERGW